jgi:type I restriction enzyme M protein
LFFGPVLDPNLSSFSWSVADLLRGDYQRSENGKVIQPLRPLAEIEAELKVVIDRILTMIGGLTK